MRQLRLDIETYSELDLPKVGVHKYVSHPSTELLMLAWKIDHGQTEIVCPAEGDKIPEFLFDTSDFQYVAHNASFEHCVLSKLVKPTPITRWRCTQAMALQAGLPGSLSSLGEALGLPEDQKKLKEGKALINLFSKPAEPSKANGMQTRNTWFTMPHKWNAFKEYNMQDVDTMYYLDLKMAELGIFMSDREQKLWEQDCRMNEAGVKIDSHLVRLGAQMFSKYKEETNNRIIIDTGVKNPNSIPQMRSWLEAEGCQVPNLARDTVDALLDREDTPDKVREIMTLRRSTNKTSVAKYAKMLNMQIEYEDGVKVCDNIQYSGAGRTARYAGRNIQIHNLPSRVALDEKGIAQARKDLKNLTYEEFKGAHEKPLEVLSALIRTVIIPSTGKKFAVADFSAIEARVIAWLAGEQWRLDVFNSHGKIYEASAAQMFNVPIDRIKKGNPEYALRAKGKVAELALGYQGGPGALVRMGALQMGLEERELPGLVKAWRAANPAIVRMWYKVQELAIAAMRTGHQMRFRDKLYFTKVGNRLLITLPSGRPITYWDVRVEKKIIKLKNGSSAEVDSIKTKHVTEKGAKWVDTDTYGGKLVENITQAIARDCLCEALLRVEEHGYDIKFHVHDEIIAEVCSEKSLYDIIKLMCKRPVWAQDLPLDADGFCCEYYRKD